MDAGDADVASFFHFLSSAARSLRPKLALPAFTGAEELEPFARRLFRALLAGLPPRPVLVLDDLHEVPPASAVEDLVRILVEELPTGAAVVLVARGDPPDALARSRAHGGLAVVAPSELELRPGEARALAARHGLLAARSAAAALNRAVGGWAAGLVLLAARGDGAGGAPVAATFDYFAGEVLDREEARTQRLLLEIALLDAPTASLAARATGDPEAPAVLARLARRGLFVLRRGGGEDPAFELHALFRAFLVARGREELPPGRADAVRAGAAAALAERGSAGAETAVGLYLDAGRVDEASRLVVREGPALLAAGRAPRVEAWLARLPAERRAEPWLAYLGAAAAIGRDAPAARRGFEVALAGFEAAGDAAGTWLAWVGAVEATILGWSDFTPIGPLVERLEPLRRRLPVPTPELDARVTLAAFSALSQHAPSHPELPRWAAAARRLALGTGDLRTRLVAGAQCNVQAGWWRGDVADAAALVAALAPEARRSDADPSAAILWLVTEQAFYALAGDHQIAARVAAEAAELAERSAVHLWDGLLYTHAVWRSLAEDDVEGARRHLEKVRLTFRGGALNVAYVQVFEALVALRSGDVRSAAERAREGKALGDAAGNAIPPLMADLVLARTPAADADPALASARERIRALDTPAFEHVLALVEADRALRAGDEGEAARALGAALRLGTAGVQHARYLFSGPELAALLAAALRRGIEPAAAARLARAGGLAPPSDAGAEWPWPVRLRTLGGFGVEREGRPVAEGPRAPRRPLEILAALAVLGARDVPEGAVCDALWPESDADAAQRALETTLHRLRRLVDRGVVVQRARRLTLARDRCWVDLLELEARLDAALAAPARRSGAAGALHGLAGVEEIARLYRGPLLPGDDAPWAAARRDRLRRKLSRWLDAVERAGGPADALRARLIAADPALESIAVRRVG